MTLQVPTGNQKTGTTKRVKSFDLIAKAARKLFDERGWYGVTREDIVKEAGISMKTFRKNVATKRNAALVAYAPLLRPIASSIIVTDRETHEVIRNFISNLANVATNHPTLVTALLSVQYDTQPSIAMPYPDEVDVVDFERLTECLGLLIEVLRSERQQPPRETKEFAEPYLFGLLKHPGNSDRAADLLINQL